MTLQKINKAQARKLYNAGRSVILTGNKTYPNDRYSITKDALTHPCLDFDVRVGVFEKHYCGYTAGYRAAFYVEV